MKMSLGLKIGASLSLTPQLQQAIRLLQLSTLELEQEIQIQLDSNPLLESIEEQAEASSADEDYLPAQSADHDHADHEPAHHRHEVGSTCAHHEDHPGDRGFGRA